MIGFRRGKLLDTDWIDLNTVHEWYHRCKESHGTACHNQPLGANINGKPRFLIDVSQDCIVLADQSFEYVALSYVWGNTQSCKLTIENLHKLLTKSSLRDKEISENIPFTIMHAIDLTRVLGVQYLWVDALCIVQDETDDLKAQELNKMSYIYQNACLTIVAADGFHADYGLHGLQAVSTPLRRNCEQTVISLGKLGRAIFRIFPSGNEREARDGIPTMYYQRAWTFQEYLFSRRRVVFEKGSVFWECSCDTWFEDVNLSEASISRQTTTLSKDLSLFQNEPPDLLNLMNMIKRFNNRQVTSEEDRLAAFSGLATAMSINFVGGFLCGLPQLFFDVALIWQPDGEMKRRYKTSREGQLQRPTSLPSWSWVGWAGLIDRWSWLSGRDFIKQGWMGARGSYATIPITTWYSGDFMTRRDCREIPSQWHIFREDSRNPNCNTPPSWTKHMIPNPSWDHQNKPPPEGLGSQYFTHAAYPRHDFWYPIPLFEGEITPMSSSPFLHASVETVTFYTRGIYLGSPTSSVCIENASGEWAGVLRPHRRCDISENTRPKMQPLELVAVSRGTVRNSNKEFHLEEWCLEERPKDGCCMSFIMSFGY